MKKIHKMFFYSFLFLLVNVVSCSNINAPQNNSSTEIETISETSIDSSNYCLDDEFTDLQSPDNAAEITNSEIVTDSNNASETETTIETEKGNESNITGWENHFYYTKITQDVFDRIYGISYKYDCPVSVDELRYVRILHFDFNGEIQSGELICNKSIAQDLVEIFTELYKAEYSIEKVRLVDEYNADDTLSMLDNNTSCFNYRTVDNTTTISKHGLGMAIDINPFYNPYIKTNPDGSLYISPSGSEIYADRNVDFPHKIDESDLCYQLFTAHGFKWGGNYRTIKDYQHFYKEK